MTTRKIFSSGGSKGYHLGGADKAITDIAKVSDAVPHNGVSYADLKSHCLKQGVLFEDPDFPAVDSTLFFSKKPPRPFVWKRPKVILCCLPFLSLCIQYIVSFVKRTFLASTSWLSIDLENKLSIYISSKLLPFVKHAWFRTKRKRKVCIHICYNKIRIGTNDRYICIVRSCINFKPYLRLGIDQYVF